MSVRVGTRLDGRYRLVDRLAYGGMGEVWRASDEVLSREIAVKILRPELAEDEAFVRRFRAEARTTSGLPHNGIAAVYDYGETRVGADGQSPAPYDDADADPVAYLVMELVPGEALSSILSREGALDPERTLDLVAQAARALHAAHLRGVIHRDIKPANLMVTPDGRVKVTDFGIARPLDHEPLTATGQVMGTAHYLAPELAKGQDASPLSDVYALGVVAYECLAGRRPFEGDNQVAVALAHLNEEPPPLPASVPPQIRAVVGAAMEKEPSRRMPSAEAFAGALEALRHRADDQPGTGSGVIPGTATAAGLAAAGLLGADGGAWARGVRNGMVGAAPVPVAGASAPATSAAPAPGTAAPLSSPTAATGALAPPGTPYAEPGPYTDPGAYADRGQYAESGPYADRAGYPGGGYGGDYAGTSGYPGGYGGDYGGTPGYPGGYPGDYQPTATYADPGNPFRSPTAPGGMTITPRSVRDRRRRGISGPLLVGAVAVTLGIIVVLVAWMSGLFGSSGKGPVTVPTSTPSVTAPATTTHAPSTSASVTTSAPSRSVRPTPTHSPTHSATPSSTPTVTPTTNSPTPSTSTTAPSSTSPTSTTPSTTPSVSAASTSPTTSPTSTSTPSSSALPNLARLAG